MMEKEIRKILTFVIRYIASKIFEKIKLRPVVISKRLEFPCDDRRDTNFISPLNMHFQRFKSTLDSLKSASFQCIWELETVVGCPCLL